MEQQHPKQEHLLQDGWQSGRCRLLLDLNAWDLGPAKERSEEFAFLLGLLPAEERADVQRFVQLADKQRALASRLLQRACAARCLQMDWPAVQILRTKGRKPYVTNRPAALSHLPNFNYNVSHEGRYVVLASEPVCLVGMDIGAAQGARGGRVLSLAELCRTFADTCSADEWRCIHAQHEQGSPSFNLDAGGMETETTEHMAAERDFRLHWSLKEAFVKARGDGLAFHPLQRAAFAHSRPLALPTQMEDVSLPAACCAHAQTQQQLRLQAKVQAQLCVDGEAAADWAFQAVLVDDHWLSVARGPPSACLDSWGGFRSTLCQPELSTTDKEGWVTRHLAAPWPPFVLVSIRDLLPPDRVDEYDQAVAAF